MASSLSTAQREQYERDGFLMPLRVLDEAAVAQAVNTINRLEAQYRDGSLPKPHNQYFRVNGHVVLPFMEQIARTPAILDAVEGILGPDLLAWSCELFMKDPGTTKVVSWHQDLTYWGLGETDGLLTAWIALSNVTVEAGCMRFIPGAHKQSIQPHKDTFSEENLLSRGQEIAVDVDENDAVYDVLKPGEMSLHHGRMLHASGPNMSSERRIGMAIRYISPNTRQEISSRDYALPVRGKDSFGNWTHVPAPTAEFAQDALRLYDQILVDQAAALTSGAENAVGLYATAS